MKLPDVMSLTPVCPVCKKVNDSKTKRVSHTPIATICSCERCDTVWAVARAPRQGYKILNSDEPLFIQIERLKHWTYDR